MKMSQTGEGRVNKHAWGKFELIERNDEEDEDYEGMQEEQEVECETTVSYNWSQLIEPRLIYP